MVVLNRRIDTYRDALMKFTRNEMFTRLRKLPNNVASKQEIQILKIHKN